MHVSPSAFLILALGLGSGCARGTDLELLEGGDSGGIDADGAPGAGGDGAGDVSSPTDGAATSAGGSGPDGSGPGPVGSGVGPGGADGDGGGEGDGGAAGSGASGAGGDSSGAQVGAGGEGGGDSAAGSGGAPPALECVVGMQSCDGDDDNGCETSLSDDADNCGACGRSCGGGVCEAAACKAQQLFVASQVFAFTFVGDDLVAGGRTDIPCGSATCVAGTLLRGQAGGAASAISFTPTTQGPIRNVATDGANVFWSHRNTSAYFGYETKVMRGALAGGAGTVLYEHVDYDEITDMKYDDGTLFWAVDRGGAAGNQIMRMGATASPVAATGRYPRFVLDDTDVYWSEWVSTNTWAIRRVARAGGAVTTLVASYNSPRLYSTDIAVDDDYLYFHSTSGVHRVSKVDGSALTQLVNHAGARYAIAIDENDVYYGTYDGVRRIPKAGGSATLLPTCGTADALQVRGDFLYYTCSAGSFTGLYRLMIAP